jgi:hypothetical protein
LRELHEVRDPLYRETAHTIVETGRPSVASLVHVIASQLELVGMLATQGEARRQDRVDAAAEPPSPPQPQSPQHPRTH